MTGDLLDYNGLMQDALRGVILKALRVVEKHGLSGEHHFYISFKTRYPGVLIPKHLLAQYPDEMTIVVQYEFWGLEVLRDRFVIVLSFNDKHERLEIPVGAITTFADPSTNFGLQFKLPESESPAEPELVAAEEGDSPDTGQRIAPVPLTVEESAKGDSGPGDAGGGDNVVALDTFRRKS